MSLASPSAIRRAAGVLRTRDALSTSALNAGMRASLAKWLSRPSHRFARSERAGGASDEGPGPDELTELRHGNPAQRERRRIVAQCNALQCAEGITGGERARGGCDQ